MNIDQNTIVGILAAAFAYGLYVKKKRDDKTDAAKIIDVELSGAEDELKTLKQSLADNNSSDLGSKMILSTNSWSKYKHLFIKDFTDKQWRSIGEFYENCETINEAITFNNEGFGKNAEAIRAARYQAAGKFVSDAILEVQNGSFSITQSDGTVVVDPESEKKVKEYIELRQSAFNELLQEALNKTGTHYLPLKPLNDVEKLLKYMDCRILDGDVGIRLRKIANRKI
ncbi:MAG: hypothetical protein JWL85_93 [Candidatus Saccharibacteria bacterium]|nr:hypothetical protein [Candidatus Saccharibacteria bacterium]